MFSLLSFWLVKAWFPGGSVGKASARNVGPWFDPWDGKIPWRRKRQPTPVLLPRKFHGWRSLVGYSPWSHKESDTTDPLQFTCGWHTDLYFQHHYRLCVGAGGPKGATALSRSGVVALMRSPSCKVRSSGCALLEQLWIDNPTTKVRETQARR